MVVGAFWNGRVAPPFPIDLQSDDEFIREAFVRPPLFIWEYTEVLTFQAALPRPTLCKVSDLPRFLFGDVTVSENVLHQDLCCFDIAIGDLPLCWDEADPPWKPKRTLDRKTNPGHVSFFMPGGPFAVHGESLTNLAADGVLFSRRILPFSLRAQLQRGRMQILVLATKLAPLGLSRWAAEYDRGSLDRAPLFCAAEELARLEERNRPRFANFIL